MNRALIVMNLLVSFFLGLSAAAEPETPMMAPYKGSAQFELLKALAGEWTGTHQMGEGEETTQAKVLYQITSNGSVLVETLFPGTPLEMVSIYHDEGDKLVMTHYCAFGNQPKMDLVTSNDGQFNFDFASDNSLDPATEGHMHALKITLDDPSHITHNWVMYQEGKESRTTILKLSKAE